MKELHKEDTDPKHSERCGIRPRAGLVVLREASRVAAIVSHRRPEARICTESLPLGRSRL
jgi:hypothetical protein